MSDSRQVIKDAINEALDLIETAGMELPEAGLTPLSKSLSAIFDDLDTWKSEAWEEMDRHG